MTRTNVYWLTAIGLTLVTIAGSALLYPSLPAKIPTHWNIRGEIDGWGSKTWAVALLPGFAVLLLVFFRLLPWLSPKDFSVDPFKTTYEFIMVAVVGLFCYLHAVTLYAAWKAVNGDKGVDVGRLLVGGIFLFLGLIGNVLGKVRRNFYIGVRVPWTLASDRVWNDTHRLAAWTIVGGSLIGFLIVVTGLSLVAAFVVLITSTMIPVVYSFIHYKRLERRGALETRRENPTGPSVGGSGS
jgi:uncharacterized membrane protein